MKTYVIATKDKEYRVKSSASEWFVLQSLLSHIKGIQSWSIYLEEH